MNKVIVSLIALAALSGVAFAGNDGSNGQSSRDLAASVIYTTAAPSVAMINRAAVVNFDGAVSVAFPTTVSDREAGASSH
jgi:hypothetical protein